jgi:hypothetical protein
MRARGHLRRACADTAIMKRLIAASLTVMAACSGAHGQSSRSLRSSTTLQAVGASAAHQLTPPLSARVVLPSTTLIAGSSVHGEVIVHNNTGHVVKAHGCETLFQVALGNGAVQPHVAFLACSQPFTIAPGASRYPVTVEARYLACTPGRPYGSVPSCQPNGAAPALPEGRYHATLFQQPRNLVPTPAPVTIDVTPAP